MTAPHPQQLSLFDPAAARAARDAGMAAAAGHAGPVWRVLALDALERLCRQQATIHTDAWKGGTL